MKTFSILDHLEQLEPSKGGKYICPACSGNDFSINKKSGAFKCWSNECDSKAIMNILAPLPQNGRGPIGPKPPKRPKNIREKERDAAENLFQIEYKVQQIFYRIESTEITEAAAAVELAAWCQEVGADKFTTTQLLREKVKQWKAIKPSGGGGGGGYDENRSALQQDYSKIEAAVGKLLSFDTATQDFYLDGKPFDIESARLTLSIDYGLPIRTGKDDVTGICVRLAQANQGNAVTEYLDQCQKADPVDLDTLALTLFGTDDPLHAIYIRKWLIAAVARAYSPGCQADDTVILQGSQGQQKSSFFRALVPNPEWFNANGLKGGKISDDEVRTAHRVWLIEVPEIDKLFKKACASELKAFMTLQREWIRPLYARLPIQLLRHSLMAGTTNEHEFFTDMTGNRRYWVCPVLVDKIDKDWVTANRDRIWSAAIAAYKAGEPHWLSTEEEGLQRETNKMYQIEHPWQGLIEQYTLHDEEISVGEIMFRVLKIDIDKASRSDQMAIAGILKSLGFKKTGRRKLFMDQRCMVWSRGKYEKGLVSMDLS
jgi:hypothetical protein